MSTPFGGTKPNRCPSAVNALFLFPIHSRKRRNPATSANDTSRRTVSISPSVFNTARFASITASSNPASALPRAMTALRSARIASSSGKPTRFFASCVIAATSSVIGMRCSRISSASTCFTPGSKSSAAGKPRLNGTASPSRSGGNCSEAAVSTMDRRAVRNFSASSRSRRQILPSSQ